MLIIVLTLFNSYCSKKNKKSSPNIVLIVIDALRADHLPVYGYSKNTSPFIKRLSKESIVFENAFSTSSWTSPATASIFTSLYPFQHKVFMTILAFKLERKYTSKIKVNKIPKKIETLPEFLKKQGYFTIGISDNLNISKREGFEQGFDILETYNYKEAPFIVKRIFTLKNKFFNKTYFLYIHFMEPHAPYHIRNTFFNCKKKAKYYIKNKIFIDKKNPEYKDVRKCSYDSEIGFVDYYIGKLYKALNWDKNTIVIITSDHGEGLWDHGFMAHGYSLYKEEINVPLIIHFPSKKTKRIKANVSTIDILPTIRDIISFKGNTGDIGVSLLKVIRNENLFKDRLLFSHLKKMSFGKIFESYSIIYKNYHLIAWKKQKNDMFKIFNFKKDKKEELDLKDKIPANIKDFMISSYKRFYIKCKKYKAVHGISEIARKDLKKLKTLGYVK